jgi:hypothetical protein
LRLGREDAAGEADASGPVADQERRSAVLVCGFRTGTALSIALLPSYRAAAATRSRMLSLGHYRLPAQLGTLPSRDFFGSEMAVIGSRHLSDSKSFAGDTTACHWFVLVPIHVCSLTKQ